MSQHKKFPAGIESEMRQLESGMWMNGFTPGIGTALAETEETCFRLNAMPPSESAGREAIIRNLFGNIGHNFKIHSPFHCDFGFNITVGDNFVANFNLTILDEAEVRIGNNVFIGPNTTLCTVIHSLEPGERNEGIMCARPIAVGDNVWIAANAVILPGVTVGEGAVIGAGSVVTKDVEPYTVVAGNPARFLRRIEVKNECSVSDADEPSQLGLDSCGD